MFNIKKTSEFARKVKHWVLGLVLVLIILFAFQNQLAVSVHFLFWSLEVSRFALITVTFAAGLFGGWLIVSLMRESQSASVQSKPMSTNPAPEPAAPPNGEVPLKLSPEHHKTGPLES